MTNFQDKANFIWHPVLSALSYRLQVSKSGAFTEPVFDESGLTETSLKITDLDTGICYYWRVNASNETSTSYWSDIWTFTSYEITLPSPVLSLPANGSVNNPLQITLAWNAVEGADEYLLQVDEDPEFRNPFFESQISFSTNWQINTEFKGSTTYYWRVKAAGWGNGMSPWSEIWSFVTTNPTEAEEFSADSPFMLYPNPGHTILYLDGLENEWTKISIRSAEGKILKQIHEKGIRRIDISDLPDGIYIVEIMTAKKRYIDKMVKQ